MIALEADNPPTLFCPLTSIVPPRDVIENSYEEIGGPSKTRVPLSNMGNKLPLARSDANKPGALMVVAPDAVVRIVNPLKLVGRQSAAIELSSWQTPA